MNAGTMSLKADEGRLRRRIAPTMPPLTEAHEKRSTRLRWPASSRRYPIAPETEPGTSPTVFETFAVTGA
jgi:hypothetical protein